MEEEQKGWIHPSFIGGTIGVGLLYGVRQFGLVDGGGMEPVAFALGSLVPPAIGYVGLLARNTVQGLEELSRDILHNGVGVVVGLAAGAYIHFANNLSQPLGLTMAEHAAMGFVVQKFASSLVSGFFHGLRR